MICNRQIYPHSHIMIKHITLLLIAVATLFGFPQKNVAQRYHLVRRYITSDTLCVKIDSARLFFPTNHEGFEVFYKKLDRQLRHASNRINILHIGGSHVQAGTLTNRLRTNLSNITDSLNSFYTKAADRGIIFPFATMKTNCPTDYTTSTTGQWSASRCISATPDAVLGLSGAAIITTDSNATLSVKIHDEAYAFEQIRVLGYSTSKGTHPLVIVGNDTIYPSLRDRQSGFLFHLPSPTTFCRIAFSNVREYSPFVVRGLMPISKRNGITYNESGINGASVPSWLGCKAMKEELSLLPPDLVIFGIGINDAATSYDGFSPEQFKDNYRMLIERILTINPKAALLFITNNDCNQTMRIRRPNLNTPRVEEAFKELAAEYNGCVFNLYQTMGGQGSAANWVSQGLMQSDRVHFTNKGYNLIGDLIYNAIINDFTDYQRHKH